MTAAAAPKTGHSNSRSTIKNSSVTAALVLDRLSFVGDLDGMKDRHGEITSQAWESWLNDFGVKGRRFSKYPYRHLISTVSGYTVELKEPNAHIPDVRVDFNPSTCPGWRDSLGILVGGMRYPRITRLDFAVDYRLDLSEWNFITENPVKSCRFMSRAGKLETLYLGASDSQLRFRIYNKAEESGLPGIWWRVEAQCRFRPGDNPFHCHPFSVLSVVRPGEGMSIEEKALLHYLQAFPDAIGELSQYKRSRYRQLLKSENCLTLSPSPAQVFQDQCSGIIQTLAGIFPKGV